MPEREILTLRETALELGLSIERVRQFIYQGRLPADRLGHIWIVGRRALDAFKAVPHDLRRRQP